MMILANNFFEWNSIFDFYESEGTVAVISKNFDHNFTIGDIGSGTNTLTFRKQLAI